MTLEALNAELARAIDRLVEQCETFVARLRSEILPAVVADLRANVFGVRACPGCRRHYAVALNEERAVMCCGREVPPDLVELAAETGVWWPHPDQFVEAPAVVHTGETP